MSDEDSDNLLINLDADSDNLNVPNLNVRNVSTVRQDSDNLLINLDADSDNSIVPNECSFEADTTTNERGSTDNSGANNECSLRGQQIQSIDLFKRSDFTPESVAALQRCDPEWKRFFRYLEDDTLPTSQKDSRRLPLEATDFVIIN